MTTCTSPTLSRAGRPCSGDIPALAHAAVLALPRTGLWGPNWKWLTVIAEDRASPASRRARPAQTPRWATPRPPSSRARPGLAEHDPLAGDADLAGVEILDDVRCDKGREHEDTDRRVRVVADLVRAFLAAREGDHVALAQLPLTLVRAKRGLAAEDDHPLLVRVVRMERPLLVARLDLVHARPDELGVDVRADPGVLDPPTLAILRAIPLGVAVEIEDLHAASLREGRAAAAV